MSASAAAPAGAAPGSVAATGAVKEGWRPVVTAFVQRQDGRVLVVRRSDQVNTYQGRWGGVSGGVESDDTSLVARAYEEIEEEVGIPRHRLRLACVGRPLPVRDGARRWLVHPFLMTVADGGTGGGGGGGGGEAAAAALTAAGAAAAGGLGVDALGGDPPVTLNWENTEARWVLPSELGALPHVPLLLETLRRVALPRYMAVHVEHLAADRVHGAAELAEYTLQAFGVVAAYELEGDATQHKELDAVQPCWQAVIEAYHNMAWHMACARPSMGAVANAAAEAMLALDRELLSRADPFGPDPLAVRVALLEAVRAETAHLKARGERLRGHIDALLPAGARVMTTSYSSTLLAALAAAAPRLGGVVCCEARPLCEGAALARALAAAGVGGVTVITDAQASAHLGSVNLVLLGADALSEAGAVNKVGSKLLALAAREEGVPVYVACDSGKVGIGGPIAQLVGLGGGGGGGGGGQEEKEPEEVTQAWPRQLRAAGAGRVEAAAVAEASGAAARGAAPPAAPAAAGGAAADAAEGGAAGGGGGGGVAVRNVYFETVPLPLLTGVVTEDGVQSAADITAAVAARRRQYLQAFDLATLHHPPPAEEGGGGGGW
ncbi:MAG: hypothetical protein J3K34DRAFT_471205 [Monoraphidium minutum]|nr:MAG: hypothetical protein J3K34DRAFT_471205 [Monoraphidium minutum]